ncbi:MAG: hypothetical protein K5841_01570 [Fretibacterium sp.]|nr:hypothetical protein [Fretibacterium sp.]
MTKQKSTILITISLFCLALAGGVPGIRMQLKTACDERDALEQKHADLNGMLNTLAARRTLLLETLKEAEALFPDPLEKDVLQLQAQEAIQRNGAELLSFHSGESFPEEEQSTPNNLALTFLGKYYDVMQVLADWRALPLRVAAFTLRRPEPSPLPVGSDSVEAYAILEPLQ